MTTDYPYPFTPKKLLIGKNHLSYLDEGQGQPLLMLHGNPTWSFYYRNLVQSFKNKYRVIVPDHMGCGFSDKPQDYAYTLENHIDNCSRLVDHLGLKDISLVVHDWGGAIGMGYAGRNPENVSSLVVLNTAAFRSKNIPFRIAICRIPYIGALLVRGLNGFAWPATWMAVSKKLKPEIIKGYLAPYNSWHNRIAVHRFVLDIPLSPQDTSWETLVEVEENLTRLSKLPMLILWGAKDFCFNDHFYEQWKDRFPQATTRYFENAGHYILEDAYEQVEQEIKQFYRNVLTVD